jgi:4-amino-4-deoxy-L-arabinose transferase-like glycosyltransferase
MTIVTDRVNNPVVRGVRWRPVLFWGMVLLLLVAAVIMRLYRLDAPFDRDGYDEGVYWQTLRAMQAGGSLYHTIFYSQPPAFLLTAFPLSILFGGTLWSARFAIALISLLALPGAYLLGRSLAGRAGALTALLLLTINPFFLAESQIIQAEAPSVAFTLLALGFAFQWWRQPEGWRGACWAALAGAALVVSILSKLLCISTIVPLVLLLLARAWQIWRGWPGTGRQSWLPILAGIGGALLAALALLLPFVGSFQDFWQGVITFHQAAGKAMPGTTADNLYQMLPALLSPLALIAVYGTITSFLRKDWLVLPLLAWLLVTLTLLATFHPLFGHHLIVLEPPLIALAVLGVAGRTSYKVAAPGLSRLGCAPGQVVPWIVRVAVLLVLFTSFLGCWQDMQYYRATNATEVSGAIQSPWSGLQPHAFWDAPGATNPWQGDLRVANDLRRAITREQWVVTDAQFIAGLADRDTPPALVDTSRVRISTGYVTLAQLEQITSEPRVHAVLFYTDRLYDELPDFLVWVAQHFHLLHDYGPGQELWVR